MNAAISIPALFSEVVSLTSQRLKQEVFFDHGHPIEIVSKLAIMQSQGAAFHRFPLIALFNDFEEKRGTGGNIYAEISPTIVIAALTSPHLSAPERMELNFVPVLYPIYDAFLICLDKSKKFIITDPKTEPAHTKIDRLFWGREGLYGNQGNVFNDFIDAIELKNIQLKVKAQQCLPF